MCPLFGNFFPANIALKPSLREHQQIYWYSCINLNHTLMSLKNAEWQLWNNKNNFTLFLNHLTDIKHWHAFCDFWIDANLLVNTQMANSEKWAFIRQLRVGLVFFISALCKVDSFIGLLPTVFSKAKYIMMFNRQTLYNLTHCAKRYCVPYCAYMACHVNYYYNRPHEMYGTNLMTESKWPM